MLTTQSLFLLIKLAADRVQDCALHGVDGVEVADAHSAALVVAADLADPEVHPRGRGPRGQLTVRHAHHLTVRCEPAMVFALSLTL